MTIGEQDYWWTEQDGLSYLIVTALLYDKIVLGISKWLADLNCGVHH
jgi:hypothetical protein